MNSRLAAVKPIKFEGLAASIEWFVRWLFELVLSGIVTSMFKNFWNRLPRRRKYKKIKQIISMTQSEYDALLVKNEKTLYLIAG